MLFAWAQTGSNALICKFCGPNGWGQQSPAISPTAVVPQTAPSVLLTGQSAPAATVHQAPSQSRSVSLVQELTQDLMNDTTKSSTSSVKVSQSLDGDGLNLSHWLYDLINCGITKDCIEAFQRPGPGTKASSATLHLLISSIPNDFARHVTRKSAYDALLSITGRFQGGKTGLLTVNG